MSVVGVVVIDCTDTGKSLPTPTLPTWIWRVWRRGARTGGGRGGIPRETLIPPLCLSTPRAYAVGGPPPSPPDARAQPKSLIGLTMSA